MRILLLFIVFAASSLGLSAQVNSVQDGDWDDINTWDCGCVPDNFLGQEVIVSNNVTITANITVNIVHIVSGGLVTINAGVLVTLDEDFASVPLQVDAGGQINVNGTLDGNLLIISPVNIDGTVVSTGSISIPDPSVCFFNTGSVYTHSHTTQGDIPLATWDVNSTVLINGMNAGVPLPPNNLNQSFGNFTWNCPAQGINNTFHFAGQLIDIQNDLTFVTSNNRPIRFNISGTGYTLNIGRDFVNQGSPLILSQSATSGNTLVNISRDYTQSGGSLTFRATNNFDVTMQVGRNFSKTSGAFAGGSGTGSVATLSFGGGVVQNYTLAGTNPAVVNFAVINNSSLNMGTSFFVGTGTFTLASGSTLSVGSTDPLGAIQTGTTAGNIRVSGLRTYNSGSTIAYNGAAAQFIGTGHPATAGVNCQINNSNGVTLASNVTIGGNLILTSGNLAVSNFTLTLNGNFTPNANFLNVTSASNLSIGGTGAFGTLATTGSTTINNFTLNRTSTGSVTLGVDLTIGGTFTQTIGDVGLNGRTLTISGPYVRTNGSINADAAASVIVDGSGALPAAITFAGVALAPALNTLTINRSGATFPTNSSITLTNLNLLSGTFDNTGTITMTNGGVLTRTEGSIINNTPTTDPTTNSYDIVYNVASNISTGSEIPSDLTQLRNVTKTGGASVTLTEPITINGTLTLGNGLFDAVANAIDLKGNLISNSTSAFTSSTLTFSGATTISGGTAPIFGNILITGSLTPSVNFRVNGNLVNNGTLNAGSATTTFGGTTTISGSSTSSFNAISITGTLNAPTGNMNVSGNWNNVGTFNAGAVSNTVTFNGTTSFTGSGLTQFSGIVIANASTLNSSSTLRVAGNFTNNGTFNHNTGTVLFNGSSAQSIAGATAATFNNITVTNVANPISVQVQSNQNLAGILTLSANTKFDADGSSNTSIFTLLSSDDEPVVVDAAIAALPAGAAVNGSVTIQRYMSIEGGSNSPAFDNGRIFRYISSPVQNPQVSQIQPEIPVTGSFTGSSSCSGCGSNQSMFLYNESVTTDTNGSGTPDLNDGYEDFPATANTETLSAGRGYTLFVRGNVAPVSSNGNARWDVRNPINSGTIAFPASFNSSGTLADDGWNLVGNPYPSTIDWDAVSGWTRTGINNAIYMTDNGSAAGTVATYINGIGANGGARYIPIGQAFWVKSDGGPITFQATESVKAPGNAATFFKQGAHQDLLRVAMIRGVEKDEAVVYFEESATGGFDPEFDAYKLKNVIFNLSTATPEGVELSINGQSFFDCSYTTPLKIDNVSPGVYRFEFTEFESFQNSTAITLVDAFLNEVIDVLELPVYEFEITGDEQSFKDRFQLKLLNTGINPGLVVSAAESETVCKAGEVVLTAEGAPAGGGYKWYESIDTNVAIAGANEPQFTTPHLEKSVTYFVSVTNLEGCEGPRKPVLAQIINFDDAAIGEADNTLSSNFTSGNQWFKDGVAIPGANSQTFKPEESGVYKVEVTIGTCTTSAERVFTVTGLEDEAFEGLMVAYPNPVKDELLLEVKDGIFAGSPRIVDLMGKEIGTIKMKEEGKVSRGKFDFRGQASGIYLLQLSDRNGKLINKRIVKQ